MMNPFCQQVKICTTQNIFVLNQRSLTRLSSRNAVNQIVYSKNYHIDLLSRKSSLERTSRKTGISLCSPRKQSHVYSLKHSKNTKQTAYQSLEKEKGKSLYSKNTNSGSAYQTGLNQKTNNKNKSVTYHQAYQHQRMAHRIRQQIENCDRKIQLVGQNGFKKSQCLVNKIRTDGLNKSKTVKPPIIQRSSKVGITAKTSSEQNKKQQLVYKIGISHRRSISKSLQGSRQLKNDKQQQNDGMPRFERQSYKSSNILSQQQRTNSQRNPKILISPIQSLQNFPTISSNDNQVDSQKEVQYSYIYQSFLKNNDSNFNQRKQGPHQQTIQMQGGQTFVVIYQYNGFDFSKLRMPTSFKLVKNLSDKLAYSLKKVSVQELALISHEYMLYNIIASKHQNILGLIGLQTGVHSLKIASDTYRYFIKEPFFATLQHIILNSRLDNLSELITTQIRHGLEFLQSKNVGLRQFLQIEDIVQSYGRFKIHSLNKMGKKSTLSSFGKTITVDQACSYLKMKIIQKSKQRTKNF